MKAGAKQLECRCGGRPELEFDPGSVSFTLRDGESGGWISKATKENKYRAGRGRTMSQRQKDHVATRGLVPNYRGQETPSWKDAQEVAYQSTYERVREEHGSQLATEAASESAKTYDGFVSKEGR